MYVVACCCEQVGDACAVGGVSAMTDVQRAGWIRRNELDQHRPILATVAAAELLSLFEYVTDHCEAGAATEMEVDEARAGNLGSVNQFGVRQRRDNLLCELARILAEGLCWERRLPFLLSSLDAMRLVPNGRLSDSDRRHLAYAIQ